MIAWIGVAFMVGGLVTSQRHCGSTLDLSLWTCAFVCLLIVGAWPVLIGLFGVNVGGRLALRFGAVS